MRYVIIIFFLIAISSCASKREATFVFKNKGLDSMMNVHVVVYLDSVTTFESEKIDIPGKTQSVIKVKIPDEPYHQGYEFVFTRDGNEIRDNHYHWTRKIPTTETFMIEQLLDNGVVQSISC